MIPRNDLARDLVIVACGISAGVHAALAPHHLAEATAAGAGFVAAAAGLAAAAVLVTMRPASVVALGGSAVLLAGLLASYVLATTSGIPVLQPRPEPFEALALATKAIEAVGLIAAFRLLHDVHPLVTHAFRPKGTLT